MSKRIYTAHVPSHISAFVASVRRKAGRQVAKAVRDGRLPPVRTLACVSCGKVATCYEHRNYRMPLHVDPVCSACNARRGPSDDTRVFYDGAFSKAFPSSKAVKLY